MAFGASGGFLKKMFNPKNIHKAAKSAIGGAKKAVSTVGKKPLGPFGGAKKALATVGASKGTKGGGPIGRGGRQGGGFGQKQV